MSAPFDVESEIAPEPTAVGGGGVTQRVWRRVLCRQTLDSDSIQLLQNITLRDIASTEAASITTSLPLDLISAIEGLGHHPFIALRTATADGDARVLMCPTHTDREHFVQSWAAMPPDPSGSNFLAGLCHALRREPAQAAFAFFDWIHLPDDQDRTAIFLCDDTTAPSASQLLYPVYDLCAAHTRPVDRVLLLAAMLDAYALAKGNDETRSWLVEALAFALINYHSHVGAFDAAFSCIAHAKTFGLKHRYFDLSLDLLKLKRRGIGTARSLPRRLADERLDADTVKLLQCITLTRGLDADEILAAIEAYGGHPFLAVRGPNRAHREILLCATHLNRLDFAASLHSLSKGCGGSQFLDGLSHALRHETYEAAFAFFDWVHNPSGEDATEILLFDATDPPFPEYCGYPIYDMCASPTTQADRADILAKMFESYEALPGNDDGRYLLIEALAFALSRHCGLVGDYDAGLNYVDRAQSFGLQHLHLDACRHTLDLKRRGMAVPPRLEKFSGIDLDVFRGTVCKNPFYLFEVVSGGDVFVCCPILTPYSIGNIESQDVDAVINSDRVKQVRDSVVDGSFRYCNHLTCAHLINGTLPRQDSAEIQSDPVMRAVVNDGVRDVEAMRWLFFGYDSSCNLSCPSCRREVITEKASSAALKTKSIAEKLAPLLPKSESLFMNLCGEFLVSRPSRNLLHSIDPTECAELNIDLISNGTLFSEKEWAKFANIHSLVRSIRISMDAATPETFERVRRGAKWGPFLENISFISRMRREGRIECLTFSFAYQRDNFREMKEFVALCKGLDVDFARFERMQMTPAMTPAEYAERGVHLPAHPLYLEFAAIVADDVFKSPNVYTDFDYTPYAPDPQRATMAIAPSQSRSWAT